MKRRIMTFLLAVCMAVSLLAVPAGAASTAAVTFSDVGDKSTGSGGGVPASAGCAGRLRRRDLPPRHGPQPGAVLQDGGLRHERQQ